MLADIISIGLKNDIIKKHGSWYEFKETKIGQGMEGAKEFLKENKKMMKELEKEVKKQI
jgi:recombination protein RecA